MENENSELGSMENEKDTRRILIAYMARACKAPRMYVFIYHTLRP